MTLKIKLKKRWITTILKESSGATPPLPWQQKRQVSAQANTTEKPGRVRA